MICYVLMAMPHGNIRKKLWEFKIAMRQFDMEDAVIALPEGYVIRWFDCQAQSFSHSKSDESVKHYQLALDKNKENLSASLPDVFHFEGYESGKTGILLKLIDEVNEEALTLAITQFACDAGLKQSKAPWCYDSLAHGILIGGSSKTQAFIAPQNSPNISFKKYELMLYLAELPETAYRGFQFRAVARVHRKVMPQRKS